MVATLTLIFAISIYNNISNLPIFRAPQLHSIERKTYALVDFFGRNSILNNFYWKLSLMPCIFLAALSPKLNVIYCFTTEWYFKLANANLSSPLAPLQDGDRHMRLRTFLDKIQFWTTFIRSFFWCDGMSQNTVLKMLSSNFRHENYNGCVSFQLVATLIEI